jgi:hypothetical protein
VLFSLIFEGLNNYFPLIKQCCIYPLQIGQTLHILLHLNALMFKVVFIARTDVQFEKTHLPTYSKRGIFMQMRLKHYRNT